MAIKMRKSICLSVFFALFLTMLITVFSGTIAEQEMGTPEKAIIDISSKLGDPRVVSRERFASTIKPLIRNYSDRDMLYVMEMNSSISVAISPKTEKNYSSIWTINNASADDIKRIFQFMYQYGEQNGIADDNLCVYININATSDGGNFTGLMSITGQEVTGDSWFNSVDQLIIKAISVYHPSLIEWAKTEFADAYSSLKE